MDETDAPPFCSQRCRLIDLGRWLDEEIGLPHEPDESPKTIDPDLGESLIRSSDDHGAWGLRINRPERMSAKQTGFCRLDDLCPEKAATFTFRRKKQ